MLEKHMSKNLNQMKGGSYIVFGPTGTGKTSCLKKLSMKLFPEKNFNIYITCTSVKRPGQIYKKIYDELQLRTTGNNTRKDLFYKSAIEKLLSETKKMYLLVLDEFDQISSRKNKEVYTIFEWTFTQKIVLVAISNISILMNWPRLNCFQPKPTEIKFSSYTKQQIIMIIKSRLNEVKVTDTYIHTIAGRVSANGGDARTALGLAEKLLDLHKKQGKVTLLNCLDLMGTVCPVPDNINTLPLQQQIVTSVLMSMIKKNIVGVTVKRLFEVYNIICTKLKLSPIDQGEFVSVCRLLESSSIIKLENNSITTFPNEVLFKLVLFTRDEEAVLDSIRNSENSILSRILNTDF